MVKGNLWSISQQGLRGWRKMWSSNTQSLRKWESWLKESCNQLYGVRPIICTLRFARFNVHGFWGSAAIHKSFICGYECIQSQPFWWYHVLKSGNGSLYLVNSFLLPHWFLYSECFVLACWMWGMYLFCCLVISKHDPMSDMVKGVPHSLAVVIRKPMQEAERKYRALCVAKQHGLVASQNKRTQDKSITVRQKAKIARYTHHWE